jgi:Fe-S cluster assembly iron-binding protein IscA
MLGDPNINLTVFVQNSNTAGMLYAYKVCDACEDDTLG